MVKNMTTCKFTKTPQFLYFCRGKRLMGEDLLPKKLAWRVRLSFFNGIIPKYQEFPGLDVHQRDKSLEIASFRAAVAKN